MASYLPHHNAPRLWQSEMQTPGPAKRQVTAAIRSGSGRSFASTWKQGINFSRSGQIAQQATGQYGNYLLYRDQVRAANAHLQHEIEKEQGAQLNAAAGSAANAMLGGPSATSPGKKKVGGPPSLGSPSTGGGNPVGPSQVAAARTPNPSGLPTAGPGQVGGWQMQAAVTASQSGMGLVEGPAQPGFGRGPGQPILQQGDTSNPQSTRVADARASRRRPAGMNLNREILPPSDAFDKLLPKKPGSKGVQGRLF